MSKKRTLTSEERRTIHDRELAIEQAKMPDHVVTVDVGPVTKDNGEPMVTVKIGRMRDV